MEMISARKQNRSQPCTESSEEKKGICSSYILRLLHPVSPAPVSPGLVRVPQMANLQCVLPPCTAFLLLSFLLPGLHWAASQQFSDSNSLSSQTDPTKAKCSSCWEGKEKKLKKKSEISIFLFFKLSAKFSAAGEAADITKPRRIFLSLTCSLGKLRSGNHSHNFS